jgi:hypothetical protein
MLFSYRITYKVTIRYTPYQLLYGLHPIESAIEKLRIIAKEKEVQRSEHRRKQEEEEKLLKRTKVKKELKRAEREGMLNIQPLAIRSSSQPSSFLECAEGKSYNEKILFAHMIIQDIDTTGTTTVEFLHISKRH